MLRIETSPSVLAEIRFAISPLHTTEGVLRTIGSRSGLAPGGTDTAVVAPWAHRARAAVQAHRLTLLSFLFSRAGHYVPDFLVPEPVGFTGDLDAELHRVTATPTERVRRELRIALHDRSRLTGRDRREATTTHDDDRREAAITGDPAATAARLALELERFWTAVMAPRWTAQRERMDADITRRGQLIARQGMAAMLGGLAPGIVWQDGELRATTRVSAQVSDAATVHLMPAVISSRVSTLVDRTDLPDRRQPIVYYPVIDHGTTRTARGEPVAELLGATRAILLADLTTGRSTTELGRRHSLSPATVSHHLGVLLRAHLVLRSREGRRVFYRQAPRARELFDSAFDRDRIL